MSTREQRMRARHQQALRDRRVAAGVCVRCQIPHCGEYTMCGDCRAKISERQRSLYQERLCAGLCTTCGIAAEDGSNYCARHRESRLELLRRRNRSAPPRTRRQRCSICLELGHKAPGCAAIRCDCGADKDPRDVACARCVQLDFWRGSPVLELLHERGPADVYDIAARLDKEPNTVTKYLLEKEKRGLVEALRNDQRTVWRLAA